MSDTPDEIDGWKRRLRRERRSNPLGEEMEAFLAEHPPRADLKSLRTETRGGVDIATLVESGREERT